MLKCGTRSFYRGELGAELLPRYSRRFQKCLGPRRHSPKKGRLRRRVRTASWGPRSVGFSRVSWMVSFPGNYVRLSWPMNQRRTRIEPSRPEQHGQQVCVKLALCHERRNSHFILRVDESTSTHINLWYLDAIYTLFRRICRNLKKIWSKSWYYNMESFSMQVCVIIIIGTNEICLSFTWL